MCFAQSANTQHVMGRGCYEDFVFFNLQDSLGQLAKIPAKNLSYLRSLIPMEQEPLHRDLMASPVRRLAEEPAPTREASMADPCAPQLPASGGTTVKPVGPNPCGTSTPQPPIANCACVSGVLPCTPFQCKGAHSSLVPHPATVRCGKNTGCTEDDRSRCCMHVFTTTTTTSLADVPGVVIADRVCIIFGDISPCDNDCVCVPVSPLNVNTTTTTTPIIVVPPVYCYDYWVESLWLGFIGFCFTVPISTAVFLRLIRPRFKDKEQGQHTTSALGADSPTATMMSMAAGSMAVGTQQAPMMSMQGGPMTSMSAAGPMMSMATASGPMGSMQAGTIKGVNPAAVGREKAVDETDSFNACRCALVDFFSVMVISFIFVHLFWYPWMIVLDAMGFHGDVLNGIELVDFTQLAWVCPFSLFSIWVAIWFTVWLAHIRLYMLQKTVTRTTESRYVQAAVDQGAADPRTLAPGFTSQAAGGTGGGYTGGSLSAAAMRNNARF